MSSAPRISRALRWWAGPVLAFALLALLRLVAPLAFVIEVLIFSIYTIGAAAP